ncbi:hypothetical protein DFH11DRAFT_1731142 [Phellopilus nigrolimitatus]|nr:hypothetical protein DFH11DRAFT_1731142 [Phellopilus nigrolimitatus]
MSQVQLPGYTGAFEANSLCIVFLGTGKEQTYGFYWSRDGKTGLLHEKRSSASARSNDARHVVPKPLSRWNSAVTGTDMPDHALMVKFGRLGRMRARGAGRGQAAPLGAGRQRTGAPETACMAGRAGTAEGQRIPRGTCFSTGAGWRQLAIASLGGEGISNAIFTWVFISGHEDNARRGRDCVVVTLPRARRRPRRVLDDVRPAPLNGLSPSPSGMRGDRRLGSTAGKMINSAADRRPKPARASGFVCVCLLLHRRPSLRLSAVASVVAGGAQDGERLDPIALARRRWGRKTGVPVVRMQGSAKGVAVQADCVFQAVRRHQPQPRQASRRPLAVSS